MAVSATSAGTDRSTEHQRTRPVERGRPALRVIEGGALARARRRRWLGVAAILAAVVLGSALLAGAVTVAPAVQASSPQAVATATVEPGQTLWDVAVGHAPPDTDPRAYLEQIERLNGFDGPVRPWTVVLLPAAEG